MLFTQDTRFTDEEVCLHCGKLAEDHECCDRCQTNLICEGTGEPSHNSDYDGVPYCGEACALAAMGL